MRTSLFLVMVSVGCSIAAPDWPMFRHDAQLTGRSELAGDISEPRIVAEHFVGAYEGWAVVDVQPGCKEELAARPCEGDLGAQRVQFGLVPKTYDLRGDGNMVPMPQQTGRQVAKILPDVPGLQTVEFDDAFGYQGGECGRMFAYDGKERRKVWETPPEDNMFMPLLLILDADGDGDQEVVVATHYRVMVFDARTGHKDSEIRIHGFRNYGFFGAADIDDDGRAEYIIVTDFSSHMDVVDYEDGELRLLWRRDIDPDLSSRKKVVRLGPNPVQDVDGDGKHEIIFNLFNDTGDDEWHVVAYDALDGSTKWDLPRRFLNGMAQFDEGKPPLLLTTDTEGSPLPWWGTLRATGLGADGVEELWRTSRARWQTWELPWLPLTRNTGATLGRQTCLVDEKSGAFYVARPGKSGATVLAGMEWNAGNPREVWRVMGPALEAAGCGDIDDDGEPEVLVRFRSPGDEAGLNASDAGLSLIRMQSAGAPPTSPVAADLDGDGQPEIIVNDAAGNIVALRRSGDAGVDELNFDELWRVPGRAMADSSAQWYGVQVADIDSDGRPEVLVGGRSDRGQAELRALDATGVVEWKRTFPHIDGSDPVWNNGCLTYWTVLNVEGKPAVYASVRRNLMHSDESYLLSGTDGSIIWHADWIQCSHALRAVGGKMVAARDMNADGNDDIVITYPDVLMVLDGRDGTAIVAHATTGSDMPGWTAYAVPILADADNNGEPEIYWTACTYTIACFDPSGKVVWHSNYKDGKYVQSCWALPALADVNADARLELVGSGFTDGLRGYDAATGRLLAAQDFAAATGPAASADINGDGRDEAIIPTADSLWAMNMSGEKLEVVWQLKTPGRPSAPIVSDLDGDGRAEIAVVCGDGVLRIIDSN